MAVASGSDHQTFVEVPGSGAASQEVEARIARRIAEIRADSPVPVDLPDTVGPQGRETYGWIDFAGLPNTRDLGGLVGADGRRIKPGLLLRSGALCRGDASDIARLHDTYHLGLVVDLRNGHELVELPDPMAAFPEARFIHADILARSAEGITQEQGARDKISSQRADLDRAAQTEDDDSFMRKMYKYLLLSESGRGGYRSLLRGIIDCKGGAVLWHCHVGRDRCGMASALVETVLGVGWQDIVSDYLATNIFTDNEFTYTYPASLRYIDSAREGVESECGGFMGYIEDVLGVTPSEVELLRERYLEP